MYTSVESAGGGLGELGPSLNYVDGEICLAPIFKEGDD